MLGFPTRAQVESIRAKYPKGTKIRMIHMTDPYSPIPSGTVGEVDNVDDAGSVHMRWLGGRTLAFIPGEDSVKIITEEEYAMEVERHAAH